MKVVYATATGAILDVYYEADWFANFSEPNVEYDILEIDEVDSVNILPCRELARSVGRVDVYGRPQFYVFGGEIYATEGWEPAGDA